MLKLRLNQYKKKDELKLDVDDYKSRVGLNNVYSKNYSMFKKSVLSKIINEINKTDLCVVMEEGKTGKKVTTITFRFFEKPPEKERSQKLLDENELQLNLTTRIDNKPLTFNLNDESMIAYAQLQSYGMSKNKALEYVTNYGTEICKIGIEKLLNEIQKGRTINNISGYLVSCIENTSNRINSSEIKVAMSAASKLKKIHQDSFEKFDSYVNNNEQQILLLFSRYEAKEKLVDEIEIDIYECLKEITLQYHELEEVPQCLTSRFRGRKLDYIKIKTLVEELKIATKSERIINLKEQLQIKKLELDQVSDQFKVMVEKDITMLKVAIADLV